MRVKEVGTRPASATIRELVSRMVRREATPAQLVNRLQIPYWQDRWIRSGKVFTGSYHTPYAAFRGHIEEYGAGHFNFLIYRPSDEIRQHSHWACFQDRSKGWYLVHMRCQPRDVSSGILTIERLITEAYEQ